MGSFRSADERARDMAVLTADDRPADLEGTDPFGRPTWLVAGESITYRTQIPYSAARRIAAAATRSLVGPDGGVVGTYDVGTAAIAKLIEGIVGWELADESGAPVAWDPWLAESLLDGLPAAVVIALSNRIGQGTPEPVAVEGAPPND